MEKTFNEANKNAAQSSLVIVQMLNGLVEECELEWLPGESFLEYSFKCLNLSGNVAPAKAIFRLPS